MTDDEFDRWIESHADTFGDGCLRYLESAAAAENWKRILGSFDVQHATEATTKLLAGELGEWRAFNDHPRMIRLHCTQRNAERARIAKAAPATYQRAYRCLTCRDSGWAWVWSIKSIMAVLEGKPVGLYQSCMPCNCDEGRANLKPGYRPFDAAVDPSFDPVKSLSEQVQGLRDFLGKAKKPQRPVYSEFAEYGGQP